MQQYKNLGGNSGVSGYELSENSITVQFKDGAEYLYTNQSAGEASIAKMKGLALSGSGLNSYISTHVKKGYASKLR